MSVLDLHTTFAARRRYPAWKLLLSASIIAGIAPAAYAQDPAAQTGDSTAMQAPGTPGAATGPTQDTADPNQASTTEDVVVTGYRRSIEESLNQKREANAFVDVITAEDIGKFPDKNVADALQRVPGVVISRDGGEGSRVSIRGLQSNLTLTLLNGNFIAGADSGEPQRSF